MYDYLVFIGRFQLFHNAHLQILKKALTLSKKVIVVIGSAYQPRTPKNPWTVEERQKMISNNFEYVDRQNILFTHAYDYSYNDQKWAAEIQLRISAIAWERDAKIGIIGCKKDDTSFYLDFFPQWEFVEMNIIGDLNATEFRNTYFSQGLLHKHSGSIPSGTVRFVNEFFHSKSYEYLRQEHAFNEEYKKQWENTKFPVIFVTTDAVVFQSGHVLMVRRKARPGKGLLALPGGFLGYNEKIVDSMIRELREETKLKVPTPVLKGSIKAEKVFDGLGRSIRGRTITHAFCIILPAGKLSPVKGGDDADKALWVPLESIDKQRDMIFEDHADIVQYFVGAI